MNKKIKWYLSTMWIFQIFKMVIYKISKYLYDISNFWIKIAHYNFWWDFASILPKSMWNRIKNRRLEYNTMFLEKKYSKFINGYNLKNLQNPINCKKIWILWWQWIDNAPDLVKICVSSIKKHSCWYEIILLDKYNYKNYVNLPNFILKKVEKKQITITHLSDIIRMALLKDYWWIWVDATIYINSNIFKSFDNKNLNSNYPEKIATEKWQFEKWCWFFIGWKSIKLFNFCYDFFIQYHKDYKYLINYFLIDYVIYIAYKNFDDIKKDIDNINIKNSWLYDLVKKFNETYNDGKWKNLMNIPFFKLSWKLKFKEFDEKWNKTIYWNFIQKNKL